jgi:hypothetical protein
MSKKKKRPNQVNGIAVVRLQHSIGYKLGPENLLNQEESKVNPQEHLQP